MSSNEVEPNMGSKFCFQCGRAIEVQTAICPHCGRAQPHVQNAYQTVPNEPSNPYEPAASQGPAPANPGMLGTTSEERNWAMACHLASFLGYIVPVVGNFVGPLLVWLTQRERFPLVDDQGRESLNFQITILLYGVVATILVCTGVGIFLFPVLAVYDIVLVIIASVQASKGVQYRYPLTLRLIS